jgi:hypothetical protein
MSDRANREQLEELHGLLTQTLLAYMANTPPNKRRASMLEVIRSFLKDNGIIKNLEACQDVAESLGELTSLDVPFLPDYINPPN